MSEYNNKINELVADYLKSCMPHEISLTAIREISNASQLFDLIKYTLPHDKIGGVCYNLLPYALDNVDLDMLKLLVAGSLEYELA